IRADTLAAGRPAPVRPLAVSAARPPPRMAIERWASRLVVGGGIVIIASILAILVVILGEVYPLFRSSTATFVGTRGAGREAAVPAPGAPAGVDEYRELGYAVSTAGALAFQALRARAAPSRGPVPGLGGARVRSRRSGTWPRLPPCRFRGSGAPA